MAARLSARSFLADTGFFIGETLEPIPDLCQGQVRGLEPTDEPKAPQMRVAVPRGGSALTG